MEIATAGIPAISVYDWSRDTTTRLTSGLGASTDPLWTPDGHRLVFTSARDGQSANLFWQRADGTGDVQRLTSSPNAQFVGVVASEREESWRSMKSIRRRTQTSSIMTHGG